jgi:hypothetical protein
MFEESLQESFQEVLIDGYMNFEAHLLDGDIGVWIFSYEYSSDLTSKEIFKILQERLKNYSKTFKSDNELRLRRSIITLDYEGFDEYWFLIDEQHRRVTVMFAGIDSPAENKSYPSYIKKFQRYASEG